MGSLPEGFRVVACDPLAPKLRDLFATHLPADSFACPSGDFEDELLALVQSANALVTRGRPITKAILSGAPSARIVQVLGRYPDRVDVDAARERGVVVATMPHGGAMAVADHTIALMLAVARKIVPGHRGVAEAEHEKLGKVPEKTSEWSFAFNWLGFPDILEINRKTLGLVGFGEIGREVARRALGFDMTVLYHQRHPLRPEWERRLGVTRASLEELLERSDFLSLHAPHTSETERLLNRERLAKMKPSAIVINTSRGGLLDEEALVEALSTGRLAGAGLDVFELEPLPRDHPLCRLPSVVLSPHVGGGSGGGQKLLIEQAVANVVRFARGEPPTHVVE